MNTIALFTEALAPTANRHEFRRFRHVFPRFMAGAALSLCLIAPVHAEDLVKVTQLMTRDIADSPGKEVAMIVVDYAPGAKDPVHRHNAGAFVYVLEGTIEMQMKGAEKAVLHPGNTFYEDPDGVHLVGKNASDTKSAKFLVVLIKDKGAPILVPMHE